MMETIIGIVAIIGGIVVARDHYRTITTREALRAKLNLDSDLDDGSLEAQVRRHLTEMDNAFPRRKK